MTATPSHSIDAAAWRADFPILDREVRPGVPLIYLDSTATAQKPTAVIDAMSQYYQRSNANVHRGIHALAEEATALYEGGRERVQKFINARTHREVIFTRNTTEAINLVARAWGDANLRAGDRILLTVMEHHSNLVPWQQLAQRSGAQLEFLPIDGDARLVLDDLDRQLAGVKLVALTHQSNMLGTINPLREITARAHAAGALVLADGAQSAPHMPVNVAELGIDFLAFSGHKMCAPTGIGVLWGRRQLLEAMPPFLGGGSMIRTVTLHEATYADIPARFEAGTPAIGEAIALGEAIDFLTGIGMDKIFAHEQHLLAYALERLAEIGGLRVYGPPTTSARGGAVSFTLDGVHPHDIAAVLDGEGLAVRAGHHCCQPLHALLDIPATARASFYLYNIPEEVDRLAQALEKARKLFA